MDTLVGLSVIAIVVASVFACNAKLGEYESKTQSLQEKCTKICTPHRAGYSYSQKACVCYPEVYKPLTFKTQELRNE